MDPAFKKALQISGGAHALLIVAMLVNFSFFDDNEVIVVPLYSASNAPLTASVVENPELKEAEKATRKKPEPKKEEPVKEPPKEEEEPKEDLVKKQEEAKKLQAEKEAEVKKKREADIALKKKKEADKKKELEKKKADEKAKQEKKKKDELAKKKKEEEIKKKKAEELKKKKAEELKKKKAEEKKRKQELERQAEQQLMQDELAEEAEEARRAARQGQLLTEKQRYVAMIVERVRQSWFTDDTMNGKECVISLSLASNGFVINMKVEGGDTGVCNAAVNAINRVGRFPMPEDPELNAEFRQLKLPFKK
jgi:colicin import membrane protein